MKNPEDISSYFKENTKDFILLRTDELCTESASNPIKRSQALQYIAELISYKKEPSMRAFYVEQVYKDYKINKKLLTEEINTMLRLKEPSSASNDYRPFESSVPEDALDDFRKYGFYEQGNCYIFLSKDGDPVEMSNFIIKPLYHLESKKDNKRLVEIINVYGIKKFTDIQSRSFVSIEMFQQAVIEEGNYLFAGSRYHFFKVLSKIMPGFTSAREIFTLGWQREGFYAFANGIYAVMYHTSSNDAVDSSGQSGKAQAAPLPPEGVAAKATNDHAKWWKPVDTFGIVTHDDKNYFSPSFSSIYSNVRQDDDEYENDRYIVYKPAQLTFQQWVRLMLDVYGNNAKVAIAYIIAALFRDTIYDRYKIFPLLFLFGEKQSGKSQLAWSLSNLFNFSLPPFNLNSGTQVGFHRRLARVNNGLAWYDEYTTNIDEKRHQSLKSAYDGVGHEKGKMTKDNRTEITKVASGVVISGQYLPTKDDNALFTRSILLSFEKKTYTDAEMANYNKLKKYEENGITGIITELLKYRPMIEKKYSVEFSEVFDKMKADLQSTHSEFEERLLRNFVTILTPLKILAEGGLTLADDFSYSDLYKLGLKMIPQLSAQISSSEALSTFWSMIEYLFEAGSISSNTEFTISGSPVEGIVIKKLNVTETVYFSNPVELLFIRFSKIHPLYLEMHRRQHGTNGVDMVSLKHYIYHHPAFIGQQDNHRFESTVSSCYVFDYKLLNINLERFVTGATLPDPTDTDKKDVPEETKNLFSSKQPPF